MNYLKLLLKYIFLFVFGGLIYVQIEILYRGWSHISMFILGGICFIICGLLNEIMSWDVYIEEQCIIAAWLVTFAELITGLIVNKWLGLNVWDYSNLPFNLWGQICLPFYFVWVLLSGVAIVLDDYVRYLMFNEEKPRYRSWIVEKLRKNHE